MILRTILWGWRGSFLLPRPLSKESVSAMAPIDQEWCDALWTQNEIGKQKEEKGRKRRKRSVCHERRILMNQFPLLFVLQRSEMAIFWPTSIGKEKREEGREGGEGQYFSLAFFPPPFKVARWQNLIPSFPWIAAGWRVWGRNPRKGRDQILQRSIAEP